MSINKQSIIGLAGHIDHGKTSIVKALSGFNTDSLKEEIHRGMTINIGFAFLNEHITLIDVPGHEKFIKNMVAGVNAIDYALLVIAADDGVMPQTVEHLEILKLFNIKDGAIIINKIDKADNEWIELIENDVQKLVKGTFLESKKIYKTDAINHKGIPELKKDLIEKKFDQSKINNGVFRMFVDRIFISKGFGSIVTGTVLSGDICLGDKVKILPQNKIAKVRGLQTHNSKVQSLSIGNRAAINLHFNDKILLKRGNHLSDINFYSTYEQAIISINILSKIEKGIINNERLRIYLGTQEVMARILFYNQKIIGPGKSAGAILKFERPIVCSIGDKFIVRKYSPLITIGGGEILDFNLYSKWNQNKEYINKLYAKSSLSDRLVNIIEKQKLKPFTFSSLSIFLNMSNEKLINLVKSSNIIVLDNNWLVTENQFNSIIDKINCYFDDYHKNNPYSNGIIKDIISSSLYMDSSFLEYILNYLLKKSQLKNNDSKWIKSNFNISLSKKEIEIKNKILDIVSSKKFNAISVKELNNLISSEKQMVKKILSIEIANKKIILIDGNLLFSIDVINNIKELVKVYFSKNDTIDVKSFKQLTNTSRKYAVPLLEYLDKINLTYRVGNERKRQE